MNNVAHFESYRLKLLPLCPIHVGSGDTVQPFEYNVPQVQDVLNVYDLESLLGSLDQRQKEAFERENGKGWHQTRTWLRKQFDDRHLRYSILVKEAATKELRDSLNDANRTGEIHLLCRNANDHGIYIPGSSVKGAIRTALLDAETFFADGSRKQQLTNLARQVRTARGGEVNRIEQQFQATAFDYLNRKGNGPDLRRDPFRQVAVTDFLVPSGMTHIDKIQVVSKHGIRDSDPSGILMYRELTNTYLGYREKMAPFEAELRLFPGLHDDPAMGGERLPIRIGWEQIRHACNDFYKQRFDDELKNHVKQPAHKNAIKSCLDAVGENDCLIRIGRHSHFECVTIDPDYTATPRMGFGKTRSFVQGVVPLGWARLTAEPLAKLNSR